MRRSSSLVGSALASSLAVFILVSCTDTSGLGTDTDGGSAGTAGPDGSTGGGSGGLAGGSGGLAGGVAGKGGTGGVGGTAGRAGSGGAGGSGGATMCGPVCAIFCEFGNVLDAKGCPTCACNPRPMCEPLTCKLACPNGLAVVNGCNICQCNPDPNCTPDQCGPIPLLAPICPGGGVPQTRCTRDTAGHCGWRVDPCPTACTKDECGPVPPVAPCPPNTKGGSISCERTAAGKCGWVVEPCQPLCSPVMCDLACPAGFAHDPATGCQLCKCEPVACNQIGDMGKCGGTPGCRWMAPGCAEPSLPAAGCYSTADLDCRGDQDCRNGKQCLKRVVHPCPGGKCNQCATGATVCL